MGNLAANRTSLLFQDELAMESLPAIALESTEWYRGGAVGITIDSATAGNIGYATATLDGTICAIFAGVMKGRRTVPASTNQYYTQMRQLALKRKGAVSFNAVTTAGNAATPTAAWRGKKVWFVSDNEVSLTPPSQQYPVYAGRVIAINGDLGAGQVASTEVLVNISDAVNAPVCNWSYMCFDFDLAVLSSNNADYLAAVAFGNRMFVRRAIVQIGLAVATGTITLDTLINGTTTGTGTAITGTLGASTVRAINSIVDFNDTFAINFASSADTTAGQGSLLLEYMPLT